MRKIILLLLAALTLFTACAKEKGEYYTREIYCMNTVISINVPSDTKAVEGLCNEAVYNIYELESDLSVTMGESDVTKFNQSATEYAPKEDLLTLMQYALDMAKNTDGAYDPTVLPLTELWNITEGGYLPTDSEVAMALSTVGYGAVSIEDGKLLKSSAVRVDLGSIAKGYALGKTVNQLSENIPYGMVSFGGNVGVWGTKPDGSLWEIGIKNPLDTEKIIGKILVSSGYVSVSGDYERYFEKDGKRYHHIFDPKTGYPADNGIRSVAVYTTDATAGDALSTALFVMGYDKAIELYNSGEYDFEALFVIDGDIKMTEGMEEMFTYEN